MDSVRVMDRFRDRENWKILPKILPKYENGAPMHYSNATAGLGIVIQG